MHPEAMYHGLVLAFTPIRDKITGTTDAYVHSNVLDLDVTRADDMYLFYTLYTYMHREDDLPDDYSRLIQTKVVPVVSLMIAVAPQVAEVVERQCREHADLFGEPVRQRMKNTIKLFNITSYIKVNQ